MRPTWVLLTLLALLLATGPEAAARRGSPGPGRPVWPRPGETDDLLYGKAVRIQARMWNHLSPEGLLVTEHRRDATGAELDHDALAGADCAIWTGCYVAAQVCRWNVTRDPDALRQVRHLARGLAALADVTGVPGRIARNVGRPLPGARPEHRAIPSPRGDGRWFRPDVSRDQLAGVTLGWTWIGRHMRDQPDLTALAARELGEVAARLLLDGLWLRDWQGRRTEHGELRVDVPFLPTARNGVQAAIGLAAVGAAAELNPGAPDLVAAAARLDRDGWDDALSHQYHFFANLLTPSNVNMTVLALLVLATSPHPNANHRARLGLAALRKATVGWWNAGYGACFLLGGMRDPAILGEIRATLHALSEEEVPPAGVESVDRDEIVPIVWRGRIATWAWKEDVRRGARIKPGTGLDPWLTHTRADWLFAYWLARFAGALEPAVGPGADPTADRVPVVVPPWIPPATPP